MTLVEDPGLIVTWVEAPGRSEKTSGSLTTLASMSLAALFAVLLIVGVAVMGVAAAVALVLLLIRGRSVES